MFFMAVVAAIFFMAAGPMSLIITIPMMIFAAMSKMQGSSAGEEFTRKRHITKREWRTIGHDPVTGRPIIEPIE